jgi:hypothetical protein
MPSYDDREPWEDDEEGDDTVPCPYCGKDVYEGAERCPYCAHYLSQEDAPARRQPWWIIFGALAVLAVVAMWILANS